MKVNDVRVEIYRSFIEDQRAPMPTDIAHRLEISPETVEGALQELHQQDIIALVPGTSLIWLAHPFCSLDAPFVVERPGGRWSAICIWDALGILALLESDGRVTTRCPDCAQEIQVNVTGGRVDDSSYVVHYGVPAYRWYEDVGFT